MNDVAGDNAGPNLSNARRIEVRHLGRMSYADATAVQASVLDEVLAARTVGEAASGGDRFAGVILTVEHPPVITVPGRAGAAANVLIPVAQLAARGVEVQPTDRGGDVTYHGPGQLVVYPIIDLNAFSLRLHDYMRLLESAVIAAIARVGVSGCIEPGATGVWVKDGQSSAKVCALGVRVRRWISMHGLALNVDPDLSHFGLIVPCGLVGRKVTSLRALLGDRCPSLQQARELVVAELVAALNARPMPEAGA
ncbi:MAG: lipoyl(octanoyl) transferase LipB [Phycisphaerales bacterium]|jgi:lipoyl(octanoyl) transferase|nr:lipoyl(octanoyl) transferase LipB [Phycisphaeraceae bacterium]